MKSPHLPLLATLLLPACTPSILPEKTLEIAQSYAELQWQPEARHIRHGPDSRGILVHTPDTTLPATPSSKGYWTPGQTATGMPYKWGGFDTPKTFLRGLAKGKKAGDISTSQKIALNDAAISHQSVGVDCSGFISRCWQLPRHTSTPDLPALCNPIEWHQLRMGDILLKKGHVMLVHFKNGDTISVYEAASIPTWRVRRRYVSLEKMKNSPYLPWRYRYIAPPQTTISVAPHHTPGHIEWLQTPY